MKRNLIVLATAACIAVVASQSFAGGDPMGACYTIPSTGLGAGSCVQISEADCANTLNGVWDAGHDCNDVDGDGMVDPFITYDQIDPVLYGNCGEFTLAGATLFADFFGLRATTNDFNNTDGDTIPCSGAPFKEFADTDCDTFRDGVDQLAPDFFCGVNWHGCFLAQYRSVGSGNGLAEFVHFQTDGDLPSDIPAEAGILNRAKWADTGFLVGVSSCRADCFEPESNTGDVNFDGITDGHDIQPWIDAALGGPLPGDNRGDIDGDGTITVMADLAGFVDCVLNGRCTADEPGTPRCYSSIDGANLDVASRWFVTIPGTGAWNKKPTEPGYGNNAITTPDLGGGNKLKSLSGDTDSLNFSSPADPNTVFDTGFAYSPVAALANQGTGYENVTYTDIRYMLVTGRNSTGENILAATRDSGSGTRNAFNNGVGVDPSWGMGENLAPLRNGDRARDSSETNVGPDTYTANCGGSSIMENAVRQRRLAVGYTGLFGGSRAAADAVGGQYELLNVKNDVQGGTNFVRPSVDAVINNDNVDVAYRIGGIQTLVTRGDPFQLDDQQPDHMANQALAAYVRNIVDSINEFVTSSGADPQNLMPVEQLTVTFILPQAVKATPPLTDPTNYTLGNEFGFNQAVSDAVDANQATFIPAFGGVRPNGSVPVRFGFDPNGGMSYSDGSVSGQYRAHDGSLSLSAGTLLGPRMHIQGDFDVDGQRGLGDIAPLIAAVANPVQFQMDDITDSGAGAGAPIDYIVPEILGDFDANGDLNADDVRYFADGLAMVNGKLDRKMGFIEVDTAAAGNYFGTTLAHGTYDAGDSRADVAGNTPFRGALPHGHDGTVDADDVDYICANLFSSDTAWGDDLDVHAVKDLSCDMTGDCIVNYDDVCEIIAILETTPGDINLDGLVNDGPAVNANVGMANPKWSDGDVDCDGDIDADDVAIADGTNNPCI